MLTSTGSPTRDRLINAGAEAEIVDQASGTAVGQIGQLAARHRRMTPTDETTAFKMRRLWIQPDLGNTIATGTFTLPGGDAEALLQAVDERADQIVDPADPLRPRLEQRRADALISMALDQTAPIAVEGPAPRRLKANIFVGATEADRTNGEAGALTRSGLKVGPNTLREIFCVGETQTTLIDVDGLKAVPTDGDRLPQRTSDFVFFRDGGCTADGCTSRYRLEPHHKTHREHGGDDDPAGLTLLCWFHHHVVIHQLGFAIDLESLPDDCASLHQVSPGDLPAGSGGRPLPHSSTILVAGRLPRVSLARVQNRYRPDGRTP